MAAFRFLHTADLHLGRRFGNLPEEVRGRLIEARHQILPRLAAAAKAHGAKHILIAGDTFDTETPSDPVWRQALTAMAAAEVTWWLIPGNHDSLAAETLWARLEEKAPANVRLIRDAGLIEMEAGVALLPAPLPSRYSGRDLTTGMATLKDNKFSAYAADKKIVADFTLAQSTVVEFSIYNTQGMLLSKEKSSCNEGINHVILNSNIKTGVYIVKATIDGKISISKVLL